MDWSYIAGYFDGEGSVSLHTTKRGQKTFRLSWCNTNKESLEKMQEYMNAGHINMRKHSGYGSRKIIYTLNINRKIDLLRALDELIPRLIIKKQKAEELRIYLIEEVDETRAFNFGKVAAVSDEQLRKWQHDENKTLVVIAKILGVSRTSLSQAFIKRGIEVRYYTKGVPKSEAHRQHMKESRQKLWENPEFRAKQLAYLSSRKSA